MLTTITFLLIIILISELMIYKTNISIKNMKIIIFTLTIIYSIYLIFKINDINVFIMGSCFIFTYLSNRWELSNNKGILFLLIILLVAFIKILLI